MTGFVDEGVKCPFDALHLVSAYEHNILYNYIEETHYRIPSTMYTIHVNFCYYSSSLFPYSPGHRRLDSLRPHLTPFVLGPTVVLHCCCSKGRCVRRFCFHRSCYSATRPLLVHRRKGESVLFFASIRRCHARSPIPDAAMDADPSRQVRMCFCHEATAPTADADVIPRSK
jgi:hypothetical protein